MSTEIESCFLTFFNSVNDIEEKYKESPNNLFKNNELGELRNIYFKFFSVIKNELEKNSVTKNDSYHFSNNVVNGFQMNQNSKSMNDFLKNNLSIINGFVKESKEIISKNAEILLSDDFKFKESDFTDSLNNFNSEKLEFYLYKLQSDVFIKWKNNNDNSNYYDDINELNKILNKFKKSYNNSDILIVSNSMIYGLDNSSKVELIKFFEGIINKYSKLDKIKKKVRKTSSEIKEKPNKKDEKKEAVNEVKSKKEKESSEESKPKKKTKEKIPATVKNSLWRKYFGENINGVCQCCKVEPISIKNFDCGHIVSEKNGGSVTIDNLKPICRLCNSSMGTMNMQEFVNKYGLDKEITI
jgi:hypothetical protein